MPLHYHFTAKTRKETMKRALIILVIMVFSGSMMMADSALVNPHQETNARQVRVVTPLVAFASILGQKVPVAQASSTFEDSLAYFPGALPSSVANSRVVSVLRQRGFRPDNTVMGSSLCSDEINEAPGSLVPLLQRELVRSGVFHLGGLGGLPFVGISGLDALVDHCPGKLFLVFGSHVGISETGVVGKILRIGMKQETSACGAAVAAYNAILASNAKKKEANALDSQEDYIVNKLGPKLGALQGKDDNEVIAHVTRIMYDLVYELLKKELDQVASQSDFWNEISEVVLLGGVVVNRGAGEDHFQPLTFESLTSKGVMGLYEKTFGDTLRS
jgi:hypothetical protein